MRRAAVDRARNENSPLRPELKTLRYFVHAGFALVALVAVAPVLMIAAVGIKLSSRGPILYRPRRIARDRRRLDAGARLIGSAQERRQPGYGGREFTVFKLRTMHVNHGSASGSITGRKDPRVFPSARSCARRRSTSWPQLLNVIRGDMALVGPRPEDPEIVRKHYRPNDLQTPRFFPGSRARKSGLLHALRRSAADANATEVYAEQLLL